MRLLDRVNEFRFSSKEKTKKPNFQRAVESMARSAGVEINGQRPFDIQVHNEAFFVRVLKDGSLGLGESYMEGWWDCDQIDQMISLLLRAQIDQGQGYNWMIIWQAIKAKFFNRQSLSRSRHVIDAHYQLGNDLFQNMLDSTMAYSCGYWRRAENLEDAQKAKYDLIAEKLGFKKGMRVLDIGCGWGGFAKHAAEKYGVEVVGITLSDKQAEYARHVCKNLPIQIRVQDYRDVHEIFDRIVEIGMFEHVGLRNHRHFMKCVHRCLKDGGLFMLHTIGTNISEENAVEPWFDRYIFPNGHLPSVTQIGMAIEKLFVMEDWHNFSTDYDKTLLAWCQNFEKNWHQIKSHYPDPFYRMWKYYLLSFAGSFRARHSQLWQIVLSKNGVVGGYESIR